MGLCLGGGTAESAAGRIKVWNVGIDEVYVIGGRRGRKEWSWKFGPRLAGPFGSIVGNPA